MGASRVKEEFANISADQEDEMDADEIEPDFIDAEIIKEDR